MIDMFPLDTGPRHTTRRQTAWFAIPVFQHVLLENVEKWMLLVENCFSLGPLFGHAVAEPALHSPCLAECSVRALLLQTGALRELHPVEGASP